MSSDHIMQKGKKLFSTLAIGNLMRSWIEQGFLVGVFRNRDLNHTQCGHEVFVRISKAYATDWHMREKGTSHLWHLSNDMSRQVGVGIGRRYVLDEVVDNIEARFVFGEHEPEPGDA